MAVWLFCVPSYARSTVISTLRWALSSSYSSLEVSSQCVHFTVSRSICLCVCILLFFILYMCCITVTRWGGPGWTEAQSLEPYLPSVLWHCWLGHLTRKTRPQCDPIVFGGTLNVTQLQLRRHSVEMHASAIKAVSLVMTLTFDLWPWKPFQQCPLARRIFVYWWQVSFESFD